MNYVGHDINKQREIFLPRPGSKLGFLALCSSYCHCTSQTSTRTFSLFGSQYTVRTVISSHAGQLHGSYLTQFTYQEQNYKMN